MQVTDRRTVDFAYQVQRTNRYAEAVERVPHVSESVLPHLNDVVSGEAERRSMAHQQEGDCRLAMGRGAQAHHARQLVGEAREQGQVRHGGLVRLPKGAHARRQLPVPANHPGELVKREAHFLHARRVSGRPRVNPSLDSGVLAGGSMSDEDFAKVLEHSGQIRAFVIAHPVAFRDQPGDVRGCHGSNHQLPEVG